jgi:hypothetical protein
VGQLSRLVGGELKFLRLAGGWTETGCSAVEAFHEFSIMKDDS